MPGNEPQFPARSLVPTPTELPRLLWWMDDGIDVVKLKGKMVLRILERKITAYFTAARPSLTAQESLKTVTLELVTSLVRGGSSRV
jgi:hypothetical protein